MARLANAFRMKVIANVRDVERAERDTSGLGFDITLYGKSDSELQAFYAAADVVSLHLPYNKGDPPLINDRVLSMMKRDAFLVNVSRGGLIDERALAEALAVGRIRAAGLDCLTQEPPRVGHPLLGLSNCVISPHDTWSSPENRQRYMDGAWHAVELSLSGESLERYAVNKPRPGISSLQLSSPRVAGLD